MKDLLDGGMMSFSRISRATRLCGLGLLGTLLATGACDVTERRANIYYNFSLMPAPEAGTHYEHFAVIDGFAINLGCFTVEDRQVNCFDYSWPPGEAVPIPNYHPAIIECECPCVEKAEDPCSAEGENRPEVFAGTIVGTVDHSAEIRLGGAEFYTNIELAETQAIEVSLEDDRDSDPRPTGLLLLRGEVRREGSVLRGSLGTPTTKPIRGQVAILPIEDGALL